MVVWSRRPRVCTSWGCRSCGDASRLSWMGPATMRAICARTLPLISNERPLLPEFRHAMPDPFRRQLLGERVLLEALVQHLEVDAVERLVLVEAREHVAG